MKKHKFLLTTHPKHIKGYALMSPPNFARLAWEKMQQELKPSEKYLEHFIEEEWVDTSSTDGFYKFRNPECPSADIPYGILSCYLIVYTEEG